MTRKTVSPPDDPSGPIRLDPVLRSQAQHWVVRLAGGDVDDAQLGALESWLSADPHHALAFARERALWQDLHGAAEALLAPDSAPNNLVIFKPQRRLKRFALPAIAASLALFLAGPSLLLNLRADQRSAVGEVRTIALPDGTTAMLDSDSALSIDYRDNERTIRLLAGRAWFDVRHEARPFMVEAMGGTTRDIGTGFEIRREADSVDVNVTDGTVEVRAPDGNQGRAIHAGERVRYSASGLAARSDAPVSHIASWRRGEILFERQPMESAIAEIARYRRAAVWTFGDFSKVAPVSGMFLIERPDEALQTLVRMRGLRLTTLPGGYMVIRPRISS